MQMVVDSNQLQSPRLKAFLEASTTNRAILTDYAAMEALQGDVVRSFANGMSIAGQHPNQIIVLKTTQAICQLSGRRAGLQRRLIDKSQTSEFPEFVRKLKLAESGYQPMVEELLKKAKDANDQLHKMLADAVSIAPAFGDLTTGFTKEERRIVRDGEMFTMKMIDTLIKLVIDVSGEIFRTHPKTPPKLTYEQLPNTFIFRNSLCCCLLALDWAASGGAGGVKSHKIRNDMIDSHFVTYATYFDGLLSNDAKAMRLYNRTKWVLEAAFG
ncbi:hypothetical protein BK648_15660 [Pseudomonas poae]|uniref:Uncharacterized protein n=1 Tax=Pseudomonas poae TaxID=200451 RepID=A0A423EYC5_9PSED|nr:hypothetical protein [Pseudomonas poae]ROM46084.1 hypothetical protein BK648_15660 [Pseudomonas poae]